MRKGGGEDLLREGNLKPKPYGRGRWRGGGLGEGGGEGGRIRTTGYLHLLLQSFSSNALTVCQKIAVQGIWSLLCHIMNIYLEHLLLFLLLPLLEVSQRP